MQPNRRRQPSAPRDRQRIAEFHETEHMRGWVAFGMHEPLPSTHTPDFGAGYREHRRLADARIASSAP